MGDILGRKQRIKNFDWIEALAKIEQAVSRQGSGPAAWIMHGQKFMG